MTEKTVKHIRFTASLFGLTLVLICATVQGQQTNSFEVGAQFTTLTLTPPGVKREVGVGGRFVLTTVFRRY